MNITEDNSILSNELIREVRNQYILDWHDTHGIQHWLRVRLAGLALCEIYGGSRPFIELFSVLHDCKRIDDGRDLEHGIRAAGYLIEIKNHISKVLPPAEFADLKYAIEHHTTIKHSSRLNVQICWDADRLDIGRVGIILDKSYLNTSTAKKKSFTKNLEKIPLLSGLPDWFSEYLN